MMALKFFIYFFSIFSFGYLLQAFIIKGDKPVFLRLTYAWALGAWLIPFELFIWFFIFKIGFNLIIFYWLIAGQVAILLYLYFKYRPEKKISPPTEKMRLAQLALITLIVIQLIFLVINVLSRPPVAYDNLSMWQFKAKILYYENKINFDPAAYAYLGGGGHPNYPWQAPLLNFWLDANLGEFNDQAAGANNIIYYLCAIILIYYFLKKYLTATAALTFSWFYSSQPLVFYHAFNGYADLTLSFYLLTAFYFLLTWLKEGEKKNLILAGLFFSLALFVKDQAVIFAIAAGLIVIINILLQRPKLRLAVKDLAYFLLALITPVLPWLFVKIKYALAVSNVPSGLGFHSQIWPEFFRGMFYLGSFNLLWYVALISLTVNFKKILKRTDLILGWLFIFAVLSGLIILYLFTEEFRYALDQTALSRNLMVLSPLVIIMAGLSFQREVKV